MGKENHGDGIMIKEYNPIWGVPRNRYYLGKITCFGDFECPQEEKILYYSKNKQELLDLCLKNNWSISELDNSINGCGWHEYYIEKRGWIL